MQLGIVEVFKNDRREIMKVITTAIILSVLSLFLFGYDGILGDILGFVGTVVIVSSVLYSVEVLSFKLYLGKDKISKRSLLFAFDLPYSEVDHVGVKSEGFGGIITSSMVQLKSSQKDYNINLSYLSASERSSVIEFLLDRCR